MSAVIAAIKPEIPNENDRCRAYVAIIKAFEDADCDTLDECFEGDPVFVEAYGVVRPWWGGWDAAKKGKPRTANPHPAKSEDGKQWALGWKEFHEEND